MIREKIEKAIQEALKVIGAGEAHFVVERPSAIGHGDYATNAALALSKILKKNPRDVGELLKKELEGKIESMERVEVAGAGFINFFLSRGAIVGVVEQSARALEEINFNRGKSIMVEYTDPNPFKEFHIGHLMSNAIGESIARLLEASGAKIIRANYQGDVGLHVAKAIWGKMQKPEMKWGEAYVYGSAEYESHKEEIDEINKKVYEKSDPAINSLYEEGRGLSLAHFEELYKVLGTTFDQYFFESESTPIGTALVKKYEDVFVESDGAKVFRGEEEGLHTRVFLTSHGLPTYEAKDLGLLELKSKFNTDSSITVTASEQNDYFKVVLAAAKHLPEVADIAAKTIHVSHGMMRFAEGKMSSRKGNVVTGESLLRDLQKEARDREDVAVGAIKYTVLKQGSGRDIIFDPVRSLSLDGDSGPYLQYAHTRALSLMREAEKAGMSAGFGEMNGSPTPPPADIPAREHLERLLLHFSDALTRAAKELEPHYVTTYLTELAGAFNSWYASERVIGGKYPQYGLLLVQAVEKIMAKGLEVLGIPAPEKM